MNYKTIFQSLSGKSVFIHQINFTKMPQCPDLRPAKSHHGNQGIKLATDL